MHHSPGHTIVTRSLNIAILAAKPDRRHMTTASLTTHTFVIVEKDHVVALDIAEILHEVCAYAQVLNFRTIDAAMAALSELERVSGAILSAPVPLLRQSGLVQALTARGGKVVMVEGPGIAEAARTEGWCLLQRPFSQEMLQSAIAGICDDAPSQQC